MAKLVEIRCVHTIKRDGKYHNAGATLTVPEEEASRLVLTEQAAAYVGKAPDPIQEPAKAKSPGPGTATGPASGGPDIPVKLNAAAKHAAIEELVQVAGVNKGVAKKLIDAGIHGVADLQKTDAENLIKIKGIGQKLADKILADAANFESSDQ